MSQAQSDEAMIAELRAKAWQSVRIGKGAKARYEHVCWRAADRLATLQSDHAEAFAGKVVLSHAAFEELRAEPLRLTRVIERALDYTGPKWPDEMSQREKLAQLYCGSIDACEALRKARAVLKAGGERN